MEGILSRIELALANLSLSCDDLGPTASPGASSLIQTLEIFRQFHRESEDNKKQVLLDQLHKQLVPLRELPQCTSQLEAVQALSDGVCRLYFQHVGQNRNVAKRAVKVLKVLHKLDKSSIASRLKEEWNLLLTDVWSLSDLQKVFQLLDEPVLVREYIQDLWPQLLLSLAGTWQQLHLEISSSTAPALMIDRCYLATKISLQLFQVLSSGDVGIQQVCEVGTDTPAIHVISSTLLEVIFSQVCSLDCKLFASNALGFLLNMSSNLKEAAGTANKLTQAPEKEGHQTVSTGDLRFEVTVPRLTATDQSWCQVVLVRGLLTCVRLDILLQQVQDSQTHQQKSLFFDVLFPLVTKFCGDVGVGDIQYHAFYALEQWLKRARTDLPHVHATSGRHFHTDGPVTTTVMQCLWNNWENPIVGVPDLVKSAFGLLLALHQEENTLAGHTRSMLFEDLFVKLAGTSWHVKGRYILLVELIPYVQVLQVLRSQNHIPTQLVQALSTNHIAPASSDVYRAFLVATREAYQKDETAAAEVWRDVWLETFMSAICNTNHLIRHNAMQHWVPCTLRLFPQVLSVITTRLQDRTCLVSGTIRLRAHMAVLKAARTLNIVSTHDMASDVIREALWHSEEDVRAEAFSIICSHPKKSDPLSSAEVGLLQEFLPLNMNSDAAAFRQVVCNNMRKLMVRLRDGSWTLLKKILKTKATASNNETKTQLMQIIGFVDWLVDLCVMSTFPGACYQRRKTALELLWIVYDHLTSDWGNEPKTSANYQTLLNWARAQGSWDFFAERNAAALLNCMEDGSTEVRELAYHLLLTSFPTPWCWWGLGEGETGDRLFSHARQLLHSPKAQECEAGALIIKLIFNKLSIQRGLDVFGESVSDSGSAPVRFIQGLLGLLQEQHTTATSNLLQAARQAPMHGVLLALRQCLSSPALWVQHRSEDVGQLRCQVSDLVTAVEAVLSLVLKALAGVKGQEEEEDSEVSPSFADMGEAISSIICESGDQEGGQDDIALTPEHELVLACCWLNIKEAGLLLGQLVDSVLQNDCELLTPEQVQFIGRMYVRILTQCRHRGAIESCNIGFLMVCKRLLSHSDAQLAAIPAQILDQVLDVISGNRSTSNITRRSAGLPLLVQAITASEPRGNYRPLLRRAVQVLLTTAQLPLSQDEDHTVDIPQVHALNVLRALFSDSTLGAAMLGHISDAVILAISGFSSPVWAIRNAAMQLYGTLLIRMLGPKRVRDEHSAENTITAREFFTRWPGLRLFLLQQLTEAVGRQGEGRFYLHPGLQPVLILLSKLGPGIEDVEHRKLLSQFVSPVMAQASSPLLSVRVLCARALVPLVSVQTQVQVMCGILEKMAAAPGEQVQQNGLHGAILQVMHLLQQWKDTTRKDYLQESRGILQAILARSWVATSSNPCPVTRTDYLKLLLSAAQSCDTCVERDRVLLTLKDEVSTVTSNVDSSCQPVASELLLKTAASVSLQLLTLNSVPAETHQQLTGSLLLSACVDVRRATLLHIQDLTSREDLAAWLWILPILQQQLEKETDLLCLELCLDNFVVFHTSRQELPPCTTFPTSLWTVVMQFAQGHKGTSVCAKALPVLAIGLHQLLHSKAHSSREELQKWSQLMEAYSHPLQPEPLRVGVGRALQQVGVGVMERIAQEQQEEDMEVVLRLTRATLALLQDEVREPRTQATSFAALLPRTPSVVQYPNIHTTAAIRVLLAYLVDRFWWSPSVWRYFLTTLYPDDPISTISQHACTGSTHLFEQEEVNVYAEVITMAKLIKDSFRNLVIKQSQENSAPAWDINYFTCAIKEVREKLSLIVPQVEKERHAGLLGVTGYSKPLAALFCYLLYVDCLFFQIRHCQLPNESDMVEEQVQDIKCHLFQLQKVPALHPILHAVLSPTGLFSLQLDLGTANVSTKQTSHVS
ncbi:PREDICTED: thyroid adenoma-associated protein homolog isoform X1 [Branchiostoma belcheri]|uniref:Thyroid adenoma-associated protein homolog isoform X1 n=1 Tax=Branchiostoma belcheri TaxID=7741 RepID=A0A6P4YE98_BRABE|nr:PREDICTED: thyroid adenoma-associated protein homolog isoform X1 [Branchiostoma belcheri]